MFYQNFLNYPGDTRVLKISSGVLSKIYLENGLYVSISTSGWSP